MGAPHSNTFTFLVTLVDTTILLPYGKRPCVLKAPYMDLNDKVLLLYVVLHPQALFSMLLEFRQKGIHI